MSTAASVESRIASVEVTDEAIVANLVDGRVISVPLAWSWRLSDASPSQRANWQLIGEGHGVHWPDVDALLKQANIKFDAYQDVPPEVREALEHGETTLAIKRFRQATGADLKEAKQFVDEVRRRRLAAS